MEKIIKWTGIVITSVVVLLLIGLQVGYYLGYSSGVAKEKAAEVAKQKEAEQAALKAINPFEKTNLFSKTTVNPFDNVKTNPF